MNTVSEVQPSPRPAIALIERTHADGLVSGPQWRGVRHFHDPQQLISSGFDGDLIVLAAHDAAQAAEWLSQLRRDDRVGLLPLLLTRPFDAAAGELGDGIAADYEAAERLAREFAARTAAPHAETSDERLLAFLHLRPQRTLSPVLEWNSARLCRYPLADALCDPGEDGLELVDRLRRRGLLETAELIERLHTCHQCGAGQLLFDEHCPQCGSIDIGEQNFLHCYACGHVGTQEEFLRGDSLRCPQCDARLRHIGVDYDRALETFACRSCRGRFTEPEVKARCLQCATVCPPDDLAERRYYRMRLSPAGALAARTGQVGDLFKLFDEFSQARPEYFLQTLDWQLNVSRRHREVQFGLVCLTFTNVQILAGQMPRHRLNQLFDALAQRLRELIRTTDLFMREDDQHCWLLLPQTDAAGVEVLRQRIVELGQSVAGEHQRIGMNISAINSAAIDASVSDARMLMSVLRGGSG